VNRRNAIVASTCVDVPCELSPLRPDVRRKHYSHHSHTFTIVSFHHLSDQLVGSLGFVDRDNLEVVLTLQPQQAQEQQGEVAEVVKEPFG
jgi:hypothetical protein